MRNLLYFVGIGGLVLLEKALLPGFMTPVYTPFIWMIFSFYVLMSRPYKEAAVAVLLMAFVTGILSGNVLLFLSFAAGILGIVSVSQTFFGITNELIYVIQVLATSLGYSVIILLLTLPKESVFGSFTTLRVMIAKVVITALSAFILTPLLKKYFSLISLYDTRVKLP